MIVHALGLKEDGIPGVPPEMGDRIAAVTATGFDLQSSATATLVGTRLALLFASRLVAYSRTQIDLGSIGQIAVLRADQHAQAALLQDVHVVVVRIPHGPAGYMLLGLLVVHRVDQAHMSIAPLAELVELDVRHMRHYRVVDVPIPFRFVCRHAACAGWAQLLLLLLLLERMWLSGMRLRLRDVLLCLMLREMLVVRLECVAISEN